MDGRIGKQVIADLTTEDTLFFYSKSKVVPPGKGKNEKIAHPELYQSLPNNFRQVLSNFHLCPFHFEGHTYNTIEHVFQAKKIALVDEEKASYFTIESGHAIGQQKTCLYQRSQNSGNMGQNQRSSYV